MASPTTPLSYDVGVIGEEEMVAEYTGPPTVDRSTKPGSIKGLNSGWGECVGVRVYVDVWVDVTVV